MSPPVGRSGGPRSTAPTLAQELPLVAPPPKRAKTADAPLAPIPSAAAFLGPADLRFLDERDGAPPTPEQRESLLYAAVATAHGLTTGRFDALDAARAIEEAARLVRRVSSSGPDEARIEAVCEQLVAAAVRLSAAAPPMQAAASKVKAFQELALATYGRPIHGTAVRCSVDFAASVAQHKKDFGAAAYGIAAAARETLAKALDTMQQFRSRAWSETFMERLFEHRHEPDFEAKLAAIGVPAADVPEISRQVKSWDRPNNAAMVSETFERAYDGFTGRILHLEDSLEELKLTGNGVELFTRLIAKYPDHAAEWCRIAGFSRVLSLPQEALSDRDVALLTPSERAVYEALRDKSGVKQMLREHGLGMGLGFAAAVSLSLLGAPIVVGGALVAAAGGKVRYDVATKEIADKETDVALGLASPAAVERAQDQRVAVVTGAMIEALSAGVLARLGAGNVAGRAGAALVKSVATQLGVDTLVGSGAAVLSAIANPAFWKRQDGQIAVLFDAMIAGGISSAAGTGAGWVIGGSCQIVFRALAGQRLRPGSKLDVEIDGVRMETEVVSVDPATGTLKTKHGAVTIKDAAIVRSDVDARPTLPPEKRAVKAVKVPPPLDKSRLSPELARLFDKADAKTKELMRKLGNDWLFGVRAHEIGNPRLTRLFTLHGDALVTWMKQNRAEAVTLAHVDHALGGRVLECLPENDLLTLLKGAQLYRESPEAAAVLFSVKDGVALKRLLADPKAAAAEAERLATQFVHIDGKRQVMPLGAAPAAVRAMTAVERAELMARARVTKAPSEDVAGAQRLFETMYADLDPAARKALDAELLGRRLIDHDHYEPLFLRGVRTPEHRYGQEEFKGFAAAAEKLRTKAPLSEALLNEVHALVFMGNSKHRGRMRVLDDEWVAQGDGRVVGEQTLANLKANPHLRVSKAVREGSGWRVTVVYKSPKEVAAAMKKLLGELEAAIRSNEDAVMVAARAQRDFVSIHPYADCNGRMSRLIMDYVLARRGGPPALLRHPGKDTDVSLEQWRTMVGEGISRTLAIAERYWIQRSPR